MATKEILSLPLTNGDKAVFLAKKSGGIYRATMDTTTSTATAFVVTADDITELYDGITLIIKNTKIASASGCTLNLNGLGAKRIWCSQDNGYCTTHWSLNQTYLFVYDATNARWELQQGRNTTTSNATQMQHNGGVKAGSYKILNGNIVVADPTTHLYKHLKDGTDFDISMPILYLASDCNANTATGNVYSEINMSKNVTQSSLTLTAYLPVFIKGTLNGIVFTPISTTPLTQTIPTTADGYTYIYLGMAYSTSSFRLVDGHPMFAFIDGAFRFISDTANYAVNSGMFNDRMIGPADDENHIYKYKATFTTETVPTADWYVKIKIDRMYSSTLMPILIKPSYSNTNGCIYMELDGYNNLFKAYRTTYNGCNVISLKRENIDNKNHIWLKLRKPVEYAGSVPNGSVTVYSLVPILSITQVDTDPGGLITLRDGYNSNTNFTASTFYGNLTGTASSASYATNAGTATRDSGGNIIKDTYLKLSGGTMTGALKFGTSSIPQFSGNPPYLLGIEAFADGGDVKWKASTAVNVGSATYATNAGTANHVPWSGVNNKPSTFTAGAGTATYDTKGNNLTTYIKNVTTAADGVKTKFTFTRGDNTTFAVTDANTTYAAMTAATTAADGASGLVPKPTSAGYNYVLSGHGWVEKAPKASTADYATNAGTATSASKDSSGNNLTTYIKNVTTAADGVKTKFTFTRGDGATFAVTDSNTTYANFTAPTSGAAGTAGLVSAPAANTMNYVLTASGWKEKAPKATNADTATYDSKANNITTYIKNVTTAADGVKTKFTFTRGDGATFAVTAANTTYAVDSLAYISTATVNGRAITFTRGDGTTFSFNTQDNNTTYANFTAPTASVAGAAGLVPAPAAGQQNYILTASGWKNTASAAYATNAGTANHVAWTGVTGKPSTFTAGAGTATYDTAGNNLTTYIKNVTTAADGVKTKFTFTRGDGTTFAYSDANTTYAIMTAATTSADGTTGLVPKPTSAAYNYVLSGHGWVEKANKASSADYATNAGTATYATNAGSSTYATSAGKATNDSAGNNINTTYIKNASVSGRTVTFTKGNGDTFSITTQDNNTTYANFTTASASAAGAAGLVPAPSKGYQDYVLTGSGWKEKAPKATNADSATNASSAGYATNAGSATYATNAGTANHANDAVTSASVSGTKITFTKGNGGTFSITTQDNNTTYAAMTAATTAADGAAGLVPKPTKSQVNYYLTGGGWATNVGTALYATNAGTATQATHATNADSATYATNAGTATKDSGGNQINTTYIKNASVSGTKITFTKGDSSTFSITTQDNNTTYAAFTPATTAADGAAGLVPKPTKSQYNYILTAHSWSNTIDCGYES